MKKRKLDNDQTDSKKMQKFSIYIKSNKFHWNAEIVTYSILLFCCGVMLFKQKVLNLEENFIDTIFMWLTVTTLIFSVILKFYNMNKIEPLRGKLEGYLLFEKDSITVGDKIYPIETIRTIKISNDDCRGVLKNISKGNLGPALSNGINNFIVLFFESGQTKRFQFELLNSNDFQNIRITLIDYHLIGKIDYWELAKVLGEKSTSDTLALTNEIEKRKTTR